MGHKSLALSIAWVPHTCYRILGPAWFPLGPINLTWLYPRSIPPLHGDLICESAGLLVILTADDLSQPWHNTGLHPCVHSVLAEHRVSACTSNRILASLGLLCMSLHWESNAVTVPFILGTLDFSCSVFRIEKAMFLRGSAGLLKLRQAAWTISHTWSGVWILNSNSY